MLIVTKRTSVVGTCALCSYKFSNPYSLIEDYDLMIVRCADVVFYTLYNHNLKCHNSAPTYIYKSPDIVESELLLMEQCL